MRKIKDKIIKTLFQRNFGLINYNYPEKKEIFGKIKNLGKRLNLRSEEAYMLFTLVKDLCKKRKGNLIEVGCFEGGSTKLICEAKGENSLFVFDTFEGLPEVNEIDKSKKKFECNFKKGQYCSDYEDVKSYLKEYKNVFIKKGIFPKEGFKLVENKKFIFVHLDVDLYKSTKDCLKFLYPRMEKGGVLISHDYSTAKGVKIAFEEFFKDKPEVVIELVGTQCMFVKL